MTDKLDEYIKKGYENWYALMRNGRIENLYITREEAHRAGTLLYKDGLFSVEEIIKSRSWGGKGRDASKWPQHSQAMDFLIIG
ncbi:MAG: hypothetical protein ACR2PR_04000 [Pseudohongiellaceae bacterium]